MKSLMCIKDCKPNATTIGIFTGNVYDPMDDMEENGIRYFLIHINNTLEEWYAERLFATLSDIDETERIDEVVDQIATAVFQPK